ncbi:MAG: response regulator transcription factor, partial [Clostridiales bacterium]
VEDDKILNNGLEFAFKKELYTVKSAYTGNEAIDYLKFLPDIIILDINLPDTDGIELFKIIKKITDVPIVFLTARDTEFDILKGLKAGSDDYITKPFSLPILLEKIKLILKKSNYNKKNLYFNDDIIFNWDTLELIKDSKLIKLTSKELKLIEVFFRNKGIVLTKLKLLELVWDRNKEFVDENTLSVSISRLRSKIETNPSKPKHLKTIFGIGYKWE